MGLAGQVHWATSSRILLSLTEHIPQLKFRWHSTRNPWTLLKMVTPLGSDYISWKGGQRRQKAPCIPTDNLT